MSDKQKYRGTHRDPFDRSESHFKKTEPEVLGVPLSKIVRSKDDAKKKDSD